MNEPGLNFVRHRGENETGYRDNEQRIIHNFEPEHSRSGAVREALEKLVGRVGLEATTY